MDEKNFSLEDLVEKGKNGGSISNEDLLDAISGYQDFDMDQIDKIYETLESNGIEITGFDTVDFSKYRIVFVESASALSNGFFEICATYFKTGNPKEMLGTNTPSMISICNQSASLRLMLSRSASKLAKLADNNDGDIIGVFIIFSFLDTDKDRDCFSEMM